MTDDVGLGSARPRRVAVVAHADGFAVTLDDRPLTTPERRTLVVATRALADIVAEEWAAHAEVAPPKAMLATRLLNKAIDRGPGAREAMAEIVAKHAETDLVCHLSHDVSELRAREEAAWAPLRDWAARELGVALVPVEGLRGDPQPERSVDAARARALALDDAGLAALAHATALLGSTVLAFALLMGRLDAEAAFAASRVDESFQEERWGVDAEAEARAKALARELALVERIMRALDDVAEDDRGSS